jgi:hypothetical protein
MESNIKANGRINLLNNSGTPTFLQDKVLVNDRSNYTNTMKHTFQNTRLSDSFFSQTNRTIIEKSIKQEVYKMSNYKHVIDRQDPDQLFIIMRYVFLQNSLNRDEDIPNQVKTLNSLVINYCVPRIYGEIMSYMKYKRDISTLVVPLENPAYYHKDNTVEMNRFI